ncbi:MAG: DUF1802 family protein [Planctomycetota bacterium]
MSDSLLVQDGRTTAPVGVALKEWSAVCDWLAAGRLGLLLRKGGVHEDEGPGRFRPEFERFALFANTEHQKPEWVKPAWRDGMDAAPAEAGAGAGPESERRVRLAALAEVAKVWKVPERASVEALDAVLPWGPPYLDMRFAYKPDRPLWLLLVRAWRLKEAKSIVRTAEYDGCRSWVELSAADVIAAGARATPAMPGPALLQLERRVDTAFGATA